MGSNRQPQTPKRKRSILRTPSLPNWIVPGKLAIGRLPSPGDSALLRDAGINTVVSLCAPSEGQLPEDVTKTFRCLRHILPDSSFVIGIQPEALKTVLELIDEQIQQGQTVYVHCLAGVERSPTVCIAYLCLYEKLELWEAVSHVKKAHPSSLPTESQLWVVRYLVGESNARTNANH